MPGAESLAELKHSARLGKTFPVGRWPRKAKNKADLSQLLLEQEALPS